MKQLFFTAWLLCFSVWLMAEPEGWKTDAFGSLSTTALRHIDKDYSILWEWESAAATISIDAQELGEVVETPGRSTFAVWIYNENAIEDSLAFEFYANEELSCFFHAGLDFTGWRTFWVMYHRDMQGAPSRDMNRLLITAPESLEKGRLYFSSLTINSSIDSRHHQPDELVPFVNADSKVQASGHWRKLLEWSRNKPDMPVPSSLTREEVAAFRVIEERLEGLWLRDVEVNDDLLTSLKDKIAQYAIVRDSGVIRGKHIPYDHYLEVYSWFDVIKRNAHFKAQGDFLFRHYTAYMLEVAQAYRNSGNEQIRIELGELFLDMFDLLYDQGWAAGSGLGTLHHLGYSMRSYPVALFLMRDLLKEKHRLQVASDNLQWFFGLGETFVKSEEKGADMDAFNTTLSGRMASILMLPDGPEKAHKLHMMRRWFSNALDYADGLSDAFKVDGSAFHHGNHYAAYATGGFIGASQMLWLLSATPFKVHENGHGILRQALLQMRFYSNKYEWPVAISGRHPKGTERLVIAPYGYMALSGTPDGSQAIDGEMAAAYLRLANERGNDAFARRFEEEGVVAEDDPVGNFAMNYATLATHRREHWLVSVKGFSRYLWGSEIYANNNLYGRYLSYGYLEVLNSGNPVNHFDNGFVQDKGWDWNRLPGTTTIYLPLEKLRANVLQVDDVSGIEEMLLSDQTYAGALSIGNENGMFAMKLSEHDKYEGSHRANKSVFLFDNRVIALGSNINNNDWEHETETTLFQRYLAVDDQPFWIKKKRITDTPFIARLITDKACTLLDNQRIGYYIPKGQQLFLQRSFQQSRDQQDHMDTQGDYAVAVLKHGKSPVDQEYHYAMLVETNLHEIRKFAQNMNSGRRAPYRVLQKDSIAHIVFDRASSTYGYAFFESGDVWNNGPVLFSNRSSMVMVKVEADNMMVAMCDPDLRLYEGPNDDIGPDGERYEVSLYSRSWYRNPSRPASLEVIVAGSWQIVGDSEMEAVELANGDTLLKVLAVHGLGYEVKLEKK